MIYGTMERQTWSIHLDNTSANGYQKCCRFNFPWELKVKMFFYLTHTVSDIKYHTPETHSTSFQRSKPLLLTYCLTKETSSTFKIGLALPKWPHFDSVDLLEVWCPFSETVVPTWWHTEWSTIAKLSLSLLLSFLFLVPKGWMKWMPL